MRKRMADSGGADNFKTGAGGLYDIDFLVGMLEARAGLPAAGKQLSTRLEALISRELLPALQGGDLLHAADLFRRVDHANRVVEGRSRKWLPKSDLLRANVESIVGMSRAGRCIARGDAECARHLRWLFPRLKSRLLQ